METSCKSRMDPSSTPSATEDLGSSTPPVSSAEQLTLCPDPTDHPPDCNDSSREPVSPLTFIHVVFIKLSDSSTILHD